MNQKRKIFQRLYSAFIFTVLFSIALFTNGQDGKALFNQKCASCHAIDKQLVGPALKGVEDRWDDKKMLYEWVRNSAAVIKKGYPRAVAVYAEYNKVQMSLFPELKDQDIDAILGYINTGGAKAAATTAAPTGGYAAYGQARPSDYYGATAGMGYGMYGAAPSGASQVAKATTSPGGTSGSAGYRSGPY